MVLFNRKRILYVLVVLALVNVAPLEAAETVTISGRVGIGGVRMTGLPGSPVSDDTGYYASAVDMGWSGTVTPFKEGYVFEPPYRVFSDVTANEFNQNFTSRMIPLADSGKSNVAEPDRDMRRRSSSRTRRSVPSRVSYGPVSGQSRVLVIPTSEVKAEQFQETTEDMRVMMHILNERFREEPALISGFFWDFGAFFGTDSEAVQAIYIQDYGTLFLVRVNYPLILQAEPKQEPTETDTKSEDPVWQQARQKVLSPPGSYTAEAPGVGEHDRPERLEDLIDDLTTALQHASNIRNLDEDEMVILTIIGPARLTGDMPRSIGYGYGMRGASGAAGGGEESPPMMMGGGGYAGGGGYGGRGGGMYGTYGGTTGVVVGEGVGRMMMVGPWNGVSAVSNTVVAIQVTKADVDAYAKGELNDEQFRQRVKTFVY